jgi:prepilin-type N-terminal cleavage/methylation domain-containing protein
MKNGFTLLEILITIAILAILISFGISYFNSSVQLANLQSSADILKTELLQTQQSATSEAMKFFVKFKEKSYIISKENGEFVKEVKLLGGTKIVKTTFKNKYPGEDCMFFNITGVAFPAGGVCLQSQNKNCRCVVISIGYPSRIRIGKKKDECQCCEKIKSCIY